MFKPASFVVLLSLVATPIFAATDCAAMQGCERKFCEIQHELAQAQADGKNYKAAGLSRALENAQTHCSNEQLKTDLQQELSEAEQDLAEYQADLQQAQQDADADKITKYEGKMTEERRKIAELQQQLTELE